MSAQPKWLGDLCRRDGIMLVPYVCRNGAWTLTDNQAMAGFQGLLGDGTLETVFPTADVLEPDDFLAFAKQPGIVMTFIYVDERLAGFAWLSEVRPQWARGNFALLKAIWGRRTRDVGLMVLDLWFHMEHRGVPVLETVGGVTPSGNRRAIKFIQSLGFNILGEVPIGSSGVVISYLTRGEFYGRR